MTFGKLISTHDFDTTEVSADREGDTFNLAALIEDTPFTPFDELDEIEEWLVLPNFSRTERAEFTESTRGGLGL